MEETAEKTNNLQPRAGKTAEGAARPGRGKRLFWAGLCLLLLAAGILVLADGRHPVFHVVSGLEIETPYGETFEDPGVYAVLGGRVFGEGKKRLPIQTEGEVDTSHPGRYELHYTVRFLSRRVRCTRVVNVVDRKAPVITLLTKDSGPVNWLEGYREEGFTAWDDLDGDVTDRVQAFQRGDEILYTVKDRAGNTGTAVRRPDYSVAPPMLQLTGPEHLTVPAALSFQDPGCTAVDSRGDDLSAFVRTEGEVFPWRAGDYELRYTITNATGVTLQMQRLVTVEAAPLPRTVQPAEKTIYLTFDDGPGPYTDRLLDILKEYDVKATFFVTCDEPECFECIGRAYREGHSVGIHTASHVYSDIYSDERAFFRDFARVRDLIVEQTGAEPNICRFPGGSSNTISNFNPGIMTRLASDVTDLGYRYFDWDVYSGDAGGKGATKDSDRVFANVTEGISDRQTAVVLQHDIKDYSVDAVERIIQWGLENGYNFRPLTAESPPVHDEIAN